MAEPNVEDASLPAVGPRTCGGRSTDYFLLKTARVSGWLLFGLVGAYLFTGYAVCGKFGVSDILSKDGAVWFHRGFDLPLLIAFLTHSATSVYFALKRWGWLKRTKNQ
ncbi:MAG TPA: hypothetical protein VGP72_25335 [Planctomycetota bacterium]